jgi:hypothetical protein
MSSSQSTPIGLRFGAELEVLTGSQSQHHMEWYLTAGEISRELGQWQVKNHVNSDHNKDAEDYTEWSIIQEVTIPNQMMANKCKSISLLGIAFSTYCTVGRILTKVQGAWNWFLRF